MRLQGGHLRLVDLLGVPNGGPAQIVDLLADGVTFHGPAVVMPMVGTSVTDCTWDTAGAGPDAVAWEIDPHREVVVGAIGLVNCVFHNCTFVGVGYAAPPEGLTQFFNAMSV